MKEILVMIAASLAIAPTRDIAVQGSPVAGRWRVIWDSAVRDDGRRVIQVVRRDTVELSIEARGDSLVATWRNPRLPMPPDGVGPGAGIPLHGRLVGDSVVLTGVPPAAASAARRGFSPLRRLTLRARYRADALEGLVLSEGAQGPLVPRRFEATRQSR
ncbi:MAG TPA: hypothetical protein VLE53_17930 [Gemmatimonadaceae bacterium]|nr:hypothetical protein [Gemmatimonadaceae bacterium]